MRLPENINEGTVIDVRTKMEFAMGHTDGAINIPLDELPGRIGEITLLKGPYILCCASGSRSAQAEFYLKMNGVANCFNAGPWTDVEFYKNVAI